MPAFILFWTPRPRPPRLSRRPNRSGNRPVGRGQPTACHGGPSSSTGRSLQTRKAANGQSILVGLAVGNQALKMSFKLWKLSFEVVRDPHQVAGDFDALNRRLEEVNFCVHARYLNAPKSSRLRTPLRT